jgi:hypothetical protein
VSGRCWVFRQVRGLPSEMGVGAKRGRRCRPDTPTLPSLTMRKPVPGKLFARVKVLSYVELAIFTALIVFWLVPGFDTETMLFGWAHGLGFVVLCIVIWIACIRREAPYTLLAATLTPVGPVGSVIGIELIERRGWGIRDSPQKVAENSVDPLKMP